MTQKQTKIGLWTLRIIAAVILLQTLFFKFSAAPESVYIFSTIGMEPWGRVGSGIAELIAAILILIPSTTGIGALLGLGVMSGAIFFHVIKLGLVVMDDHGQLFIYALLVFISCLILVYSYRRQLLALVRPAGKTKMETV
ncbi:MAG: DoxX family protein [Chitinophagaceae bacterium]